MIARPAFLELHEVSQLSRSSRYLLEIIRPVIYRAVHILPKKHLEAGIQLLSRDAGLAQSVQFFSCFLPSRDTITAILNMTNLNNLQLGGLEFADAAEQAALVEFFRGRDRPLMGLRLYPVGFKSDDFSIPGIITLAWKAPVGEALFFFALSFANKLSQPIRALGPQLWSILEASKGTLETLAAPLYCHPEEDQLWSIHFPNLRQVTLQ
jgi:hypothetical protein